MLVAANPALNTEMPDLLGTVKKLLAQLEEEPVTVSMERGDQKMTVTIGPLDCASGASTRRLKEIESERENPGNLLADAIYVPFYPATCEPCSAGDVGPSFRGPLECNRPVLFVSGVLDARTPPTNVEEIRAGFKNHAHFLATHTGHGPRERESEKYCELVHFFLKGGKVEDTLIELPPVEFQPLQKL